MFVWCLLNATAMPFVLYTQEWRTAKTRSMPPVLHTGSNSLAVTNKTWCDFIIHTTKGMYTQRILEKTHSINFLPSMNTMYSPHVCSGVCLNVLIIVMTDTDMKTCEYMKTSTRLQEFHITKKLIDAEIY